MRFGDPFGQTVLSGVIGDVPTQQLQESFLVEQAVDEHVQGGGCLGTDRGDAVGGGGIVYEGGENGAVVVDVPRRVVVQRGERGAVPGDHAVGDHGEHAEPERVRELAQIGGDLRLRRGDVCCGGGILQLHQHHR